MKKYRSFLYQTAMAWVFIIFVAWLLGLPLLREISTDGLRSSLQIAEILATFLLLALAFVLFSRLKYWILWVLVLIALAVLGSGIDLPPMFLLFPVQLSIVHVSLTLIAILIFWVLEKLIMIYSGSDTSLVEQSDPLIEEEDETISLNLEDEHRDAKTLKK